MNHKKFSNFLLFGINCFLVAPYAYATTGLSALAGLREAIINLGLLACYMLAFLLAIIFFGGWKTKSFLIAIFFSGLLFVAPFQYINWISFHYVKPINNLPKDRKIETVEIMDERFIRRKDGELVYFSSRFGGNYNYWKIINPDTPIQFEKDGKGFVKVSIYDKKRGYELSRVQSERFGENKYIIPMFAFEVPQYRILSLTGQTLPKDWKATGAMLYAAAGSGASPNWVRYLLERGADLDYQYSSNLETPLHRAIGTDHYQIAQVLIEAGARPDVPDKDGVRPIDQVTGKYRRSGGSEDISEITALLRLMEGSWQPTGEMLLVACKTKGDPSWVSYLIERGVQVNYQDVKNGNSALHLAVMGGRYETAKVLVGSGAESGIVNRYGKTPGDYIKMKLEYPKADIDPFELKELLDLVDTDWHATGKMLHLSEDNPQWIRVLIDHGANAEFKNGNGDNALHYAVQMKNYANARALIESGVDIKGTNGPGLTLLESLTLFIDKSETRSNRKEREELIGLVKGRDQL